MSWKGFTKAVSRLPHTLSTKTGIRDETTDYEFKELSTRFTNCEKTTTVFLAEICKYRDSVTAMLNYQAEFGIVLAEVYDANIGEPEGEVTPRRVQTAPESIQAVDDFQVVMREIRDLLLPEVDKVESAVVQPITEMQNQMKLIRKTIVKRDHKMQDYDRFRISLKKLQDKKERTLSDEKQIFKLESQLEVATADYEGLNGLLKEELPGFFWLRTQLMEPILLSLYYIQARIHAILWDRIDPLSRSGYYDLTMDVLNGYESRKDDINLTLESVELIKKGSATQTSKYGRPSHDVSPTGSAPGTPRAYGSVNKPSPPPPPAAKPWQTAASSKPWQTAQNNNQPSPPAPAPAPKSWVPSSGASSAGPALQAVPKPWQARKDYVAPSPPPAYGSPAPAPAPAPAPNNGNGSGPNVHLHVSAFSPGIVASVAAAAASTAYQQGKTALGKKPPPPPVPKRMGARPMVVALYDYDAQQAGDLSFRKDDRIEIVEKTANADDWWTGKLNGQQGVFPGNYVQEI
ncbi:MAG: hypothetical protein BYD32DRAFT_415898 [Podila humilis]|nr:MAG: hypothetical protein BYD32DRAFT_415898 [Podila humilis]